MGRLIVGDVVRFGVIGVGGQGQGHCRAIAAIPETELTAVCDNHAKTAASVGADFGAAPFVNPTELFGSGLCDAVLVATPHPIRPPIVIDAMKHGLHVLSEKPLSERVSTADKMLAAAKKADVAFGIMFQRRSSPAAAKAIEIVRQGLVGRVYRTTMICAEFRSQAYYDSGGWRATWAGEGGGVLVNQAPHLMDLFVMIGGVPEWVQGRAETRLHDIDVEDHAEALLRYPGGGTGYVYCSTCESGPGQMIEVFGDRGKLTYRDGKLSFYRFEPSISEFNATNTNMWKRCPCVKQRIRLRKPDSRYNAITRNFAQHLLTGEPLIAPAEEGFHSLELANAIWLSAHQNKPVKVPISRRAYDAFLAAKRKQFPGLKAVQEDMRVTDTGGR